MVHTDAPGFSGGMLVPGPHSRTGVLLAGRGGFDVGNRRTRFRLMLDLARAMTGEFHLHDAMGGDVDLSGLVRARGRARDSGSDGARYFSRGDGFMIASDAPVGSEITAKRPMPGCPSRAPGWRRPAAWRAPPWRRDRRS